MMEKVDFTWKTSRSTDSVRSWVQTGLTRALRRWGYRTEQASDDHFLFVRRRSFWPIAFISPLAFLVSPNQKDQAVITISQSDSGLTQMAVIGELPRRVAAVLRELPQAKTEAAR